MKKVVDFCFILMKMEKAFLSRETNKQKYKRTSVSCLFKLQSKIGVGNVWVISLQR